MLGLQAMNNSRTERAASVAGIEDYEFNFVQKWASLAKFVLNADLLLQGIVYLIKKYKFIAMLIQQQFTRIDLNEKEITEF